MSQIVYSRNSVASDWKCQRYRYLGHEYEGCGLSKDTTPIELFTGVTLHDALAAIAHAQLADGKVNIDDIASRAGSVMLESLLKSMSGELGAEEYAHEQATLLEGLLRGFGRHVWPRLMKQYPRIILIEAELKYEHDGIVFLAKPDLVLGDDEGNIFYIEYKSTSYKKEEWVNSWATAIQLHATARCIEQRLGEKVTGVIVQGLYKGYVSYGKQNSPLCYSYHRAGNPPFSQEENLYEYRSGFKKYPVHLLDGGIKNWIANMPSNLLGEQFPQTPPIFIKEDLVEAFFKQRAVREQEISEAVRELDLAKSQDGDNSGLVASNETKEQWVNNILNKSFPQNFDQCTPSFGRPCVFRQICHGAQQNPLDIGFKLRDTSHRDNWGSENAE